MKVDIGKPTKDESRGFNSRPRIKDYYMLLLGRLAPRRVVVVLYSAPSSRQAIYV